MRERDRIEIEYDMFENSAPTYERTARRKAYSKENVGQAVLDCIKLFEEKGLTMMEARAAARMLPDCLEINLVNQMDKEKIKYYFNIPEQKAET